MPNPFPGMNPFLELPGLWEEVHTRLVVAIADWLGPRVRPKYRVGVEQRSYVDLAFLGGTDDRFIGKPDVLISKQTLEQPASPQRLRAGGRTIIVDLPAAEEVIERYLEVRSVTSGEVVTVIEVLSPSNKRGGEGRRVYESKRIKILATQTSLVEIDLIRSGEPMPMRLPEGMSPGDYRIVVSRSAQRPKAEVYPFSLREPIPEFPVPLISGDAEPLVPLNELMREVFDRAGFDLAIHYESRLEPPLSAEDRTWVGTMIAGA